jgi:hypothetical protein
MDMAPPYVPLSPPSVITERTPDAVERMVATERALFTLQQAQPLPPANLATGRDAYLSALDTWWETSPGGASPIPRTVLASRLADAMRDDALLRAIDGTVDRADSEWLAAFAQTGGALLPTGIDAHELLVDGTPYAGAVVLTGQDDARAWAFMPDRGWASFPSLAALHEALDDQLRHDLITRDTVPGLRVRDVDAMVVNHNGGVQTRPMAGPVMATLSRRIVAVQREQIVDAWDNLGRGDTSESAADTINAALDLLARIDMAGMQVDREHHRLSALHARRLAAAPVPAQQGWREAASEFRAALAAATKTEAANDGVDEAILSTPPENADALRSRRDTLIAALGVEAGEARQLSLNLARARLAMATADARLGYYQPNDPPVLIPDHAERGYQWLKAVIDAPSAGGRRRVDGHEIVVRQFTYRGAVVGGVLAIGVRNPSSVPRVILYMPDAPGGQSIREFEDAAAAARHVLYSPRFEAWLLERLPASHGYLDGNGQRRFAIPEGTQVANWAFGRPGSEGLVRTAEPFGEQVVEGNIFDAMFRTDVSRMVVDMSELEEAMRAAETAIAWGAVEIIAHAGAPVADLVRETFTGIGNGLRALWRVEDMIKAGDHGRAFVNATEAYVNLLALAPGAHFASRPSLYLRGVLPRPPAAGASRAEPAWARAFDTRYASSEVNLAGSMADARGIHSLGTRRYIVSSGTPFEVRFDAGNGTWRLVHPNAGDTVYSGPPIRHGWDGWRVRNDIGLRGGGRQAGSAPPPGRSPSEWRTANETDYQDLSAHQRGEFLRVLRQRLGGAVADDLHAEVLLSEGRPVRLTRTRFDAWSDALQAGRHAPATPPPPPPTPELVPGLLWREVPPGEWPDSVWYYPRRAVEALDQPTLYLPAVRVRGSGFSGLVASPLDPGLWAARGGVARHGWVEVNLRRMRGPGEVGGQPALRVFVNDSRGTPHYVLRTSGEVQGSFLVLRPGEFSTGG